MTPERLQASIQDLANQASNEENTKEVRAIGIVLLACVSAMNMREHMAFMVHVNKYAAGVAKRAEKGKM